MSYDPLYPSDGTPYLNAMAEAIIEYLGWETSWARTSGKSFNVFGRNLEERDDDE